MTPCRVDIDLCLKYILIYMDPMTIVENNNEKLYVSTWRSGNTNTINFNRRLRRRVEVDDAARLIVLGLKEYS